VPFVSASGTGSRPTNKSASCVGLRYFASESICETDQSRLPFQSVHAADETTPVRAFFIFTSVSQ
jgi:hypothetical protein